MLYSLDHTRRMLRSVLARIGQAVHDPLAPLDVTAWITREPVPFDRRTSGRKRRIAIGQQWGELWDCAWFLFEGTVPHEAAGSPVVLLVDVSGEACVFDEKGCPVLGLTTADSGFDFSLGKPGKRVVPLLRRAKGGEGIHLWADAGCNDLFGNYRSDGALREAHIARLHPEMEALYFDFEVLLDLMDQLPQDSARMQQVLHALLGAAQMMRAYSGGEAREARRILAPELARRNGDASLSVSAVGHAHIDLAWLWPIRESIRKGARTFATALRLMDDYPDFVFGASQAQLYEWMKAHYPTLYGKVRARAAEGRWEVQGAMWVEADTNVPSGESLVRQVLYGKRYFRREFGQDMKILWLPDVFGYSAALPQILAKSGVPYFMTQKLSWSRTNRYPHHTFWWAGLDGSRVLAHLPPEDTYNSSAAPRAIAKAERNFADKDVSDRMLVLFGIGDGGGGPGVEHLERLTRLRDLAGIAPVVQEPSLRFFEHIAERGDDYATWHGELYLEYHRGTYTTQARSKRYNRKLEVALREAELASVLAARIAGRPYPQAELDGIWKEVLLYQFHDILPGSSITRVYTESLARYAKLLAATERITQAARKAVNGCIDTSGARQPYVIGNSLSWARTEWARVGERWVKATVPPMGYAVVDAVAADEGAEWASLDASESGLENDVVRVAFAEDGTVSSVFDKEQGREAVAAGGGANRLVVHEDPGDAWDFPPDYDTRAPEPVALVSRCARIDGPRAVVRHVYRYGESEIIQDVTLTTGSRRIDFVTRVDWRETHRMLRTEFPVAVFATEATCEIQFGSVRRPTHRNTSWDEAKFEVCAQRWVDLSQRDYGVALLNDCKYGHKLLGNVLDLNLLRSPTGPDPVADKAVHELTYSLYPHAGDHVEGRVTQAAHELNVPLAVTRTTRHNGGLQPCGSAFEVDAGNVIIDTVKKAEDSDDVIVRLYESAGAGATVRFTSHLPLSGAWLVGLMEENAKRLKRNGDSIKLTFRPFEIHTVRLSVK